MSRRFVRKSFFRHVFGQEAKKESTYFDIKLVTNGDGNHIAASSKYIIYSTSGGGGPCCVVPYEQKGRVGASAKKLNVHTMKTTDFAFSPFNSSIVATASDDCCVGVSVLPSDPKSFDGKPDSKMVLEGHQKKVDLVRWQPTANGILSSISHDGIVKIWDVEEGKEALEYDVGGVPNSLRWNENGSLFTVALSNKKTVIVDPRKPGDAMTFKTGFTNGKNQFMDGIGYFGVGGTKMGAHEYCLYDLKNTSEPVQEVEVDGSAGMLLDFYDPDTKILFLGCKGGSSIKYWECTNKGEMFKLSLYQNKQGVKGWTFLPKVMCDWKKCMIAKSMLLFRERIVPVDFIVPRKSSLFAADIYPDTYAGRPALDGSSWIAGENKDPVRISMNPKKQGDAASSAPKIVSKAELIGENAALKKKVAELEAEIAKLKAS